MRRVIYIVFLLLNAKLSIAQMIRDPAFSRIFFEHFANGKPIVLNDSLYKNSFGEVYSVSKLKYYVSNFHFVFDTAYTYEPNVFLINAALAQDDIWIERPTGHKIKGVEFLLGVDSSLNCSGAQGNALDPVNDMFWTWSNGYVMFKLEGMSTASAADNHRIEHHIGGYKGTYKTMRTVFLAIQGDPYSIEGVTIRMDLDAYWNGINKIKISETPLLATMGNSAIRVADNFPGLFSIAPTIYKN